MTSHLHPALPFLVGAVLVAFLRGRAATAAYLATPIAALANLLFLARGEFARVPFAGETLVFARSDDLSFLFGLLFCLASVAGFLFSARVRDPWQRVAAPVYVAGGIGAVYAGDLVSLLLSWEVLALSSVFLIFARRRPESLRAGLRYLVPQLGSGVLLMIGIAIRAASGEGIAFGAMSLDDPGALLIFLAIGIKCAFPGFHTWLTDGYASATPSGAVFLCSITTKVAVYAMARAFAGTEVLVTIGVAMAVFPIFYAVIENDLRRVLAYSMINQIGFMMVGIGIGSDLGINGAVAHAFNDVFFKGLLFMSMGAVLARTGTIQASELGGLVRTMPFTAGACMIGAASISAFPLFSGFVSKSMIMVAAAEAHADLAWFLLLFAAAGVFHHAGIKIPFFAFFAHDSGRRPAEAPLEMRLGMGFSALMCVVIGCAPGLLYALLPNAMDYWPYDAFHVISQLQLLFFAALAFTTLQLTGIYPPELRSVNLDLDWLARAASARFVQFFRGPASRWGTAVSAGVGKLSRDVMRGAPSQLLPGLSPLESSVLLALVMLFVALVASFLT